ncbi:MAG: hypothetical protein R3D01_05165 [Hyphomicrobiales bacterium]
MDDDAEAPRGGEPGGANGAAPPAPGDMRASEPVCPEPAGPDERGIDWSKVWTDFVYSGEAVKRTPGSTAPPPRPSESACTPAGWERVVPMSLRPRGRKPGPRSGEPPTVSERRRAGLINRLFKMLDANMSEIETRLKADDERAAPPTPSATCARPTTIMQAYAKLAALDDAARAGDGASGRETT